MLIIKRLLDENKYYKELIDNNIKMNKIIKVPLVFTGKEPFIIAKKTD